MCTAICQANSGKTPDHVLGGSVCTSSSTQDEEAEGERSADVIVGGAESESDIPPAGSLEEAPAADTSADPNEENEAETLATDSA